MPVCRDPGPYLVRHLSLGPAPGVAADPRGIILFPEELQSEHGGGPKVQGRRLRERGEDRHERGLVSQRRKDVFQVQALRLPSDSPERLEVGAGVLHV